MTKRWNPVTVSLHQPRGLECAQIYLFAACTSHSCRHTLQRWCMPCTNIQVVTKLVIPTFLTAMNLNTVNKETNKYPSVAATKIPGLATCFGTYWVILYSCTVLCKDIIKNSRWLNASRKIDMLLDFFMKIFLWLNRVIASRLLRLCDSANYSLQYPWSWPKCTLLSKMIGMKYQCFLYYLHGKLGESRKQSSREFYFHFLPS